MLKSASRTEAVATAGPAPKLVVQTVGNFEASFVPTVGDFFRLDERFRLPERTWQSLPDFEKTYGFAVFKLKSGNLRVHPMAFSFPNRDPRSLFFPTVHIHDGKVHATADFDHSLYCQPSDEGRPEVLQWAESSGHGRSFVDIKKAKDIILADQHCYKKEMRGVFPNTDIRLAIHS